jgi:hypothetical protein
MLAFLHILTIKSDFICTKLHKTFFLWKNSRYIKPKIDNQNIATCNLVLVGIQQYGFVKCWFVY